ncbi:MAG: hypothetical protein M0T78_07885 [Actinomycetota bacterium]|nr:hypothetical protein [Actinomycetota bacterium]
MELFKGIKEKHDYEQAKAVVDAWNHQHEELQKALNLIKQGGDFTNNTLNLQKGEGVYIQVHNVSLLGDVKSAGHYVSGHQGISIPIGSLGGRSVRYNVGRSKGHYEAGATHEAGVDTGQFYITNTRIIFVGTKKTTVIPISTVISANVASGAVTVSSSKLTKTLRVWIGSELEEWVSEWIKLALAVNSEGKDKVAEDLTNQIVELEAAKPNDPINPNGA